MNDDEIDERFAIYPPATVAAICAYRQSHDPALVGTILDGIMDKHLSEQNGAPALSGRSPREVGADLNAFGLESLTMLEVVMDLEDALEIRLENDEVRGLKDLTEVRALLLQKAVAAHPETLPPVA